MQFPRPPAPQSFSPQTHHRGRSHTVNLSIDTNVASIREGTNVRISRVALVDVGESSNSLRRHNRPLSGFSTSDMTGDWRDIDSDEDAEGESRTEDALFYSEHFSSNSLSELTHTDGRHLQNTDYTDEPDDISPDTPLLVNSPAIPSSHASFSRRSSVHTNALQASKGNKILRSLRSRSTLRLSSGKFSRRSSSTRTQDTRTPISKDSFGTISSDSPRSERRKRTQSNLTVQSLQLLPVDSTAPLQQDVPPMPVIPGAKQPSPPIAPPSAWSNAIASPSRRAVGKVRLHRPTGPRPRSSSNASAVSKTSSGGGSGSGHSRGSSLNENTGLLSVVEERSASGSLRTSVSGKNVEEPRVDLLSD